MKFELNKKMDNKLPTKEEYEKRIGNLNLGISMSEWSEPKYLCSKCGGEMRKNLMIVLTSIPPKYEYRCDSCGHIDYQYQ